MGAAWALGKVQSEKRATVTEAITRILIKVTLQLLPVIFLKDSAISM